MAMTFASGNVRAKYKVAHAYICTGIYDDARSTREWNFIFSSQEDLLHTPRVAGVETKCDLTICRSEKDVNTSAFSFKTRDGYGVAEWHDCPQHVGTIPHPLEAFIQITRGPKFHSCTWERRSRGPVCEERFG